MQYDNYHEQHRPYHRLAVKNFMNIRSSIARMRSLFVTYHTLIRRNGKTWVLKENQKIFVSHIVRELRSQSFRQRIESDLDLPYHTLKKYLKDFMDHKIEFSWAFENVDNGPRVYNKYEARTSAINHAIPGSRGRKKTKNILVTRPKRAHSHLGALLKNENR